MHKATVTLRHEPASIIVLQTPAEVKEAVEVAIMEDQKFVTLTLGNPDEWNGRPCYIDPNEVVVVCPPMKVDNADDDD